MKLESINVINMSLGAVLSEVEELKENDINNNLSETLEELENLISKCYSYNIILLEKINEV